MITTCKDHLTQCLISAGVPRANIAPDLDEMAKHRGRPPQAALLVEAERIERDGSRVAGWIDGAQRVYRRRLYRRTVPISVVLAHETETQANALLEGFLTHLGRRIRDEAGNVIRIQTGEVTWWDDASFLRGKVKAQVMVRFVGGVYQDEPVRRIPVVYDFGFVTKEV